MGAETAEIEAATSIPPVRRKPIETPVGGLPVINDSIQTWGTYLLLQTELARLSTQAACRWFLRECNCYDVVQN